MLKGKLLMILVIVIFCLEEPFNEKEDAAQVEKFIFDDLPGSDYIPYWSIIPILMVILCFIKSCLKICGVGRGRPIQLDGCVCGPVCNTVSYNLDTHSTGEIDESHIELAIPQIASTTDSPSIQSGESEESTRSFSRRVHFGIPNKCSPSTKCKSSFKNKKSKKRLDSHTPLTPSQNRSSLTFSEKSVCTPKTRILRCSNEMTQANSSPQLAQRIAIITPQSSISMHSVSKVNVGVKSEKNCSLHKRRSPKIEHKVTGMVVSSPSVIKGGGKSNQKNLSHLSSGERLQGKQEPKSDSITFSNIKEDDDTRPQRSLHSSNIASLPQVDRIIPQRVGSFSPISPTKEAVGQRQHEDALSAGVLSKIRRAAPQRPVPNTPKTTDRELTNQHRLPFFSNDDLPSQTGGITPQKSNPLSPKMDGNKIIDQQPQHSLSTGPLSQIDCKSPRAAPPRTPKITYKKALGQNQPLRLLSAGITSQAPRTILQGSPPSSLKTRSKYVSSQRQAQSSFICSTSPRIRQISFSRPAPSPPKVRGKEKLPQQQSSDSIRGFLSGEKHSPITTSVFSSTKENDICTDQQHPGSLLPDPPSRIEHKPTESFLPASEEKHEDSDKERSQTTPQLLFDSELQDSSVD